MACGLELQPVMDLTTERTRALTGAAAAVVELREEDAMVYRAVSGSARGSLGLRLNLYKSLSGRCVLEARTLQCADSEEDPRVDRDAARRVGARSMLCVPLLHEGNAAGVLKVYSPEPDYFNRDDVTTLELMVGFIAAATAHAVAQRAREALEHRFRVLAELATDGIITADARGIVTFWNRSAAELFGYPADYLLGKSFTCLMPQRYPLSEALAPGRFDSSRVGNLLGRIIELQAVRADGSEFPVELSASQWSIGNEAYFTAIVRDASERKRLEAAVLKLAHTDELTGLLSRRAGQAQIDREVARSQRYRHSLSFVLIDVDHFKQINDTKGHAAGDEVLRRLGKLIAERVRSSDVAVRWGGEEFLLALPHTDQVGARALAEALRASVEQLAFEVVPRVTFSAGIAVFSEGEPSHVPIARADAKLYQAKSEGRNRVAY